MDTPAPTIVLAFAGTLAGLAATLVAIVAHDMPAGYAAAFMAAYCAGEFASGLDWHASA